MPTADRGSFSHRAVIHPTNAWNPTGQPLLPVPECRLYYAVATRVSGVRTQVFLGSQHHLTFVADFEGEVPVQELRTRVIADRGVYPHLIDLYPAPGLPAPTEAEPW